MYDNQTISQEKRTRWLAYGALVAACLMPLALAFIYPSASAFEAGKFLGQILMVSAVVIGAVRLIFKNSSSLSNAKATLSVAIFVLVWSGTHFVTEVNDLAELKAALSNVNKSLDDRDAVLTKAVAENQLPAKPLRVATTAPSAAQSEKALLANFLNKAAEANQKQTETMRELSSKFEGLDLSGVLAPENLVDAGAITRSWETLSKFSGFLDERNRLFSSLTRDREAMLQTSGLPPKLLEEALKSFNRGKASTAKLMSELDKAQRGTVTAAARILTLCEENLGQFVVKDNNLQLQTEEQLALYREQLANLQAFAAEEERITQRLIEADTKTRDAVRRDLAAIQ